MKKKMTILASIIAIAILTMGAAFGTMAYFSDLEQVDLKSSGTLNMAVIDIYVDDSEINSYYLDDLKPCHTSYITFEILNNGKNPVDVYKHLYGFVCIEGTPGDIFNDDGFVAKDVDQLPNWILYDLSVEIALEDNTWWQMIYDEDVTMGEIECEWIYLGMLPAGKTMIVTQSYHLHKDTGNWAQGDTMTFNIEVRGDQLTGVRVLENKDPAYDSPPKWKLLRGDGIKGTLTYTVRGPTFKGSFTGKAPLPSTDYDLIYYPDPWPGTGLKVLGSGTSDGGGLISFTFDIDCGNLPVVTDPNRPGAKVWLVPKTHHNGDGTQMNQWTPGSYLFETGLIEYTEAPAP